MGQSPKQDLSQERLHGAGSEESFVPRCLQLEWSRWEASDMDEALKGRSAGTLRSIR